MSLLTRARTQLSLGARPLRRSLATPSPPGSPSAEPINLERGNSRTPYVLVLVAATFIGAYYFVRDTEVETPASAKVEEIMQPVVESNKGNRS